MHLISNKISTGKAKSFEDFIKDFKKKKNIKTASVKVAEQEEADSSGQLDVEPLHQEGESTTMPKAGPSAKKDDGDKSAVATAQPDEEGKDSGQPKAEGSEKLTNDPEVPSKEEKGGSVDAETKVAGHCSKCKESETDCTCDCKDCTASKDVKVKTAALEDLPQAVQDKIKGKSSDEKDDSDSSDDGKKDDEEKETKTDKDEKEEKEAATKCEKCKCEPCTCKDASKKVEFVKIANLDEKNKGFLKEYWRQLFGDDYVNALISDK